MCRCDRFYAGDECENDMREVNSAPPKVSLRALFRRFTPEHADFLCCPGENVEKGIVEPMLDANHRPVYNESTPACSLSECGVLSPHTTHGAASFNDWFTSPVVINTTLDLYLKDKDALIYEASFPRFFPLDEDFAPTFPTVNNHTYLFTTEIHSEFIYLPGQFFSFYGDDDVWVKCLLLFSIFKNTCFFLKKKVFVNDKLVLDLGGTHRSLGGSVSLDDVAKEQSDFDFFEPICRLCCWIVEYFKSVSCREILLSKFFSNCNISLFRYVSF